MEGILRVYRGENLVKKVNNSIVEDGKRLIFKWLKNKGIKSISKAYILKPVEELTGNTFETFVVGRILKEVDNINEVVNGKKVEFSFSLSSSLFNEKSFNDLALTYKIKGKEFLFSKITGLNIETKEDDESFKFEWSLLVS